MELFINWLTRLFSSWKPWVIVAPWEMGVRVRLGKIAQGLPPGPHFRIPLLDRVVLVNTRMRIGQCPPVCLSTPDGRSRVVKASVGYTIIDPLKAMVTYTDPEAYVTAFAQAEAARLITPEVALAMMQAELELGGIRVDFVRYVDDVTARVFRLMMGSDWSPSSSGVYQSVQGQERY